MTTFKQYLMNFVAPKRSAHLNWQDGDIQIDKPSRRSHFSWKSSDVVIAKPDRSSHLAWKPGDLEHHGKPPMVKESWGDEDASKLSPFENWNDSETIDNGEGMAAHHGMTHDQLAGHLKHHDSLRSTPRFMMKVYKNHSTEF